jgi:hypothetical protein
MATFNKKIRSERNIKWLAARVALQHHQAVTDQLLRMTPEQRAEADAAGLSVNECLRRAFDTKNGAVTVPQCAMKVLRNIPDFVDPQIVVDLYLSSFLNYYRTLKVLPTSYRAPCTNRPTVRVVDARLEACVQDDLLGRGQVTAFMLRVIPYIYEINPVSCTGTLLLRHVRVPPPDEARYFQASRVQKDCLYKE